MVRNLLEALSSDGSVKHVALVTGLKHYLGPFETYGKGKLPATPFREEQGRLAGRELLLRAGGRGLRCRRSAMASAGACIVRTRSSATRSATR